MTQGYLECNEKDLHTNLKIIVDNNGEVCHVVYACGLYLIIYKNRQP